MTPWKLDNLDPLHLTIAADGCITPLTYVNDQIWELSLTGGEPPALALSTTFGLRARSMRLFPRFQHGEFLLSDPQSFFHPPLVTGIFPNFVRVNFAPFNGIDVVHEIWAASSQVVAGRLTFSNPTGVPIAFVFEWTGMLSPLGSEGRSLAITPMGVSHVLTGATEDLQLVCFMTGGPAPNSGPLPALALDIDLQPGKSRQITWALASLGSTQESYELARLTTAREWEAETAHIELLSASRVVEIQTGQPEIDAALAMSQKIAHGLIYSPGGELPQPSFVLARTPEQGYSLRGDGSDYTHLWNGQTALDAWYLSGVILPGMESIAAGLIENFLSVQEESGFIDWKPGMAGQRAKRLAQPVLATLAWQVYETQPDPAWLVKIYPRLLAFVQTWFEPQHDDDQDGFPEWDHPYQIGLDAIPLFNLWQKDSQGVEPGAVESPALAAFLYRECLALSQMASLLGRDEDHSWLNETANRLRESIESLWDSDSHSYTYRDTFTHLRPEKRQLLSMEGSGTIPVEEVLEPAQHLLVRIKSADDMTRQAHLIIHGQTLQGPTSEDIPARRILWLHGEGRYTTRNHFTRVNEIIARNLQSHDICEVTTIDFTARDISLLLPLWAGIPDPERAKELVERTILTHYLFPYGLGVSPRSQIPTPGESLPLVNLPWNRLIAEGLLHYNYRKEAADLIERMLKAVILNLKETHIISTYYSALTGRGSGDRAALPGLAPVGLFLQAAGLKLLSQKKIMVEGLNPFPWPINVQYRGIKFNFLFDRTQIEFPGAQPILIKDPGMHVISRD